MIPVPMSDEEAVLLHESYKAVHIYVDGLRPVNGVDFFDGKGAIALPLSHERWATGKPDEPTNQETGIYFTWRHTDDAWAHIVYSGVFRRCLCNN